MFNNEYPYTNIHEINLDWVIKNVQEIRALVDKYIVNYEQITFADPISWDYPVAYPMHTIVLDQSYNAYLSKQDVPSYTQLNNSDYWLQIGDFFQYIEKALSNLAFNEGTREAASKSYASGELLINNDVLYRAMVQMAAGTTFVIDSNIEQVTVESLMNELKTNLSADIAANTAAINANAAAIHTNANNIATNTANIETNAANIATNLAAIQTNAANIAAIKLHEVLYDVPVTDNAYVQPFTKYGLFTIPQADKNAYGVPIVAHTIIAGAPAGTASVEPAGQVAVVSSNESASGTVRTGVIFLKVEYQN